MNAFKSELESYLSPTAFVDSASLSVMEYAENLVRGETDEVAKAVKLYYAVRDDVLYDPYDVTLDVEHLKASFTLKTRRGWCVSKAVLLAAAGRAVGVAARLGFADVRNHLTTERLKARMQTDIYAYHGYTEFFLNGRWVKATPAFNLSLCEKFGVKPLEFDGQQDSIFHEFDQQGNRHMEYVRDYGQFADVPLADIVQRFKELYPFYRTDAPTEASANFEDEGRASEG